MDCDRTPNKKLLILSDGNLETSSNARYQFREDLKMVVETIKYPYISIGILSNAVIDYYKNYRVVSNVGEFISVIGSEINKLLK